MNTIDIDQLSVVTGAGLGDIIHSAVQAAKNLVVKPVTSSIPALPALPAEPSLPALPSLPYMPRLRSTR